MIRNDPDLQQALADLAPVFEAYRAAERDVARLDPVMKFAAHNAAEAQMIDQLSIIHYRAGKFAWDGNALFTMLAEQSRLRTKLRRKPNTTQMSKALGEKCASTSAKAEQAAFALEEARKKAEVASRNAAAAQAASLLYTGYSA